MKQISIAFAGVAALALTAGCSGGAVNNATANAATANTVAPVANSGLPAPAPTPGGTGAIDAQFVAGHWGLENNCAETISFNADGTAEATGEDGAARWTLSGDTITLTPPNGRQMVATVAREGDDMIVTPQGRTTTQRYTRCAAAAERPARPTPVPPAADGK